MTVDTAAERFWTKQGVMKVVRSGQLIKAASIIRTLFPEATPQQAVSIVLDLRTHLQAKKASKKKS